jgi:glycosyltransferase involved in cell wall biosynthesis
MDRLLITSTYLPPITGGAEQVAWQLANRLTKKFEVHILTTGKKRVVTGERVTVHYVNRYPLLTLLYSTVANSVIKQILRDVSPDIIHCHIPLPWGYVFRGENSKKVITCHGSDIFPPKGYPKRHFLLSSLKDADRVTVQSTWLRGYLNKEYGISSTIIPNGVDTKTFHPMENVTRQRNLVLFVGRVRKQKGILDLIAAAKELTEYEFLLVGDKGASDFVEIPTLPNVRKIGFQSNVVPYYARANLCVFPSHWESFALVGLEAMACGRTLVATKTGFSEYVENGREGILVDPHDVGSLVRSIRYLMENDGVRRTFEENARKKAAGYDWDAITDRYIALYETI